MALFAARGVLRGFAPAACEEPGFGVPPVRLAANPCAALRDTKKMLISELGTERVIRGFKTSG